MNYGIRQIIYQQEGSEIYALENSNLLMWERVSFVPEDAEKISKKEAEYKEDLWRAMAAGFTKERMAVIYPDKKQCFYPV